MFIYLLFGNFRKDTSYFFSLMTVSLCLLFQLYKFVTWSRNVCHVIHSLSRGCTKSMLNTSFIGLNFKNFTCHSLNFITVTCLINFSLSVDALLLWKCYGRILAHTMLHERNHRPEIKTKPYRKKQLLFLFDKMTNWNLKYDRLRS